LSVWSKKEKKITICAHTIEVDGIAFYRISHYRFNLKVHKQL